ncbi:MAG: circularly permuted type 2 ATP-grasp protein, partial [Rhodospirillales bacterium]|nr:circularly permuted type 2 ATP-grasp protein [Rhodospirillales bacterium]
MGAIREIGNDELGRRAAALNRQMGLAAPLGAPPTRVYDPLPALLTAADFALLEDGLRQRANLLSLVLEDVYGAQNLMRSGQLPPALVFAEPHFLRPLHTRGPLATPRLGLYAADVIR